MYSRVTYAEQEGITPRYAATFGTTWVPSPKLVINCTAGSGRWREESLPVTLRDGIRGTTLGLPANVVSQMDSPHMPQFKVSDYATLSNGRILNFPRRTDNARLNATRELGKHSLKFGFSLENSYLNSIDIRSTDSAFDRGMTSGPNVAVSSANSGNSVASPLLGTGIGTAGQILRPPDPGQLALFVASHDQRRSPVGTAAARTERYSRYNRFDYNARNPLSQSTGLGLKA